MLMTLLQRFSWKDKKTASPKAEKSYLWNSMAMNKRLLTRSIKV